MTSPVVAIGMRGGVSVILVIAARKSSSIGSISGEWNAWLTVSCLVFSNFLAILATAVLSPAMTTLFGPLTAAIDTFLDLPSCFLHLGFGGEDGDHRAARPGVPA